MGFLKKISGINQGIPSWIRFILGLIILNIPVIIYLSIVGPGIAPIYVAVIFLLINIAALLGYFKLKEVEVNAKDGIIRVRK